MRNLSLQNRIVLYTGLAHALVHMIELTYAALLLRIGDEFGQGAFMLGVIANVFAFMFGAGALPAGFLVDRLGSRRVMSLGFLCVAAASVLVGLSPNAFVLGVFLGLLGLSIGLYHPAGLSMIAHGAEKRGLAIGYHGVAGNLGVALAPAVAVGLAVAIDWRAAYFFLGGLAVLIVLLMRAIRLPDVERRPATASAPAAAGGTLTAQLLLPLLLVYAAYTLNGFIYRGSFTWLPAHVEENVHINVLGIDEQALAGSLTTLALLTGCLGQFVGGTLSQRHALERLAPPLALCLVPALLLMGVTGGLALVAASAVFVFFNFTGQPVYNGLIAEYTPHELMGRSYGISFFAAFGLGSSAASVSGFFAEHWGTASVFLSLAGFALLGVALTLAIWRLAGQRRGLLAEVMVEISPDAAADGGQPTAGGAT